MSTMPSTILIDGIRALAPISLVDSVKIQDHVLIWKNATETLIQGLQAMRGVFYGFGLSPLVESRLKDQRWNMVELSNAWVSQGADGGPIFGHSVFS
jgi:hypothetical protein